MNYSKTEWLQSGNNLTIVSDHLQFKLHFLSISIPQRLDHEDVLRHIRSQAVMYGAHILEKAEDLPFYGDLITEEEKRIADYLVSTNTSIAYAIIQESGMTGLYEFINDQAVDWIEKQLLQPNEILGIPEILRPKLEISFPLILDSVGEGITSQHA